ncbi:MAG: hypothetical protein KCHDKBKB_02612 [Elusimicrobia bacterium]|nr:hypothetical protein [Elusimicrobiota bacterium]
MQFIKDLLRWFVNGGNAKNELQNQPISDTSESHKSIPLQVQPKNQCSPTFDFLKESRPEDFLIDLQSIRPLAEQFDRAREDLLHELQRLAPRKKRLLEIFKDAA